MYKVLIVDDEPQMRAYLGTMIPAIDSQWEVVGEAANGNAALEMAAHFSPDLVLTDIRMPEMDGIELCERLSAQPNPPLMAFVSGYDEFRYAKDAIRMGVSEYLLKPLNRRELSAFLNKIAQRLAARRRQNEQLALLEHLSSAYQKEVMRNFCRAALDNVYIRIQTLQPLLHQMQNQELQSVWCVLAVCSTASAQDGYERWSQDQYLLVQLVRQLVEEELDFGYVLEADDSTLLLCLMGENEEQVYERCTQAAQMAGKLCEKHFGAALACCRSDAKLDVLQLHEARKEADLLFPLVALHGPGTYAFQKDSPDEGAARLVRLSSQLVEAWQKEHPAALAQAIVSFCQAVVPGREAAALRMLLHQAHMKHCPHLQTIEKQLLTLPPLPAEKLAEQMQNIFLAQSQEVRDQTVGEKLVADAIRLIRDNLDKPISLGSIADMLAVSANHLSRVFHATTGESYIKFVTRERMERAGQLLLESLDVKVLAVAEQTGYYNIQHFCYVFKKYWNMTPTQYQHTHGAGSRG